MKPNTRIDNFLAKIAGDPDANEAMVPRSPEEYYLDQIAQNGGGGGGGSDSSVLVVHDVDGTLDKTWKELWDAINAEKLVLLFTPYQNGDFYYSNMVWYCGQVSKENEEGWTYLAEFSTVNGATPLTNTYYTHNENGAPVKDE